MAGENFIEGVMLNSNHEPGEGGRKMPVDLEQIFPKSDKAHPSDYFNIEEFAKRENLLDQRIASLIRRSILETVRDARLSFYRGGKHSNYFVINDSQVGLALGKGISKIGVRRLRERKDFEDEEVYGDALKGFQSGIRIQDLAYSKGVRVPELYFLIHERTPDGERSLFCGMEHIDGLTLGQICNPDRTIGDIGMQADEMEENVREALRRYPQIRSWSPRRMMESVRSEFATLHDASESSPIVHRDCHEENIIFSFEGGAPTMIDFDDGSIGDRSDDGFAERLETYRDEEGHLFMTDGPMRTDSGMTTFNAIDNLDKYLAVFERVLNES